MIYKIEALKLPYTTVFYEEAESAALALEVFRRMRQYPDAQCVSMSFATLHRRWWHSDPRDAIEPCQYRYNEVPAISEWRVFRMWASDEFHRRHSFCSTYNLTRETLTVPDRFPLCAIRRVYGFQSWGEEDEITRARAAMDRIIDL